MHETPEGKQGQGEKGSKPMTAVRKLLLVALLCWLAPLIGGGTLFLAYLFTRSSQLLGWGLSAFMVSLVLALIGGLLTGAAVLRGRARVRAKSLEPAAYSALVRSARITAALLVSNVVLCFGLAAKGIDLATEIRIVVINQGKTPLTQCRLSGPGLDANLAPLAPGETRECRFHADNDGTVSYTLQIDSGSVQSGTVIGYVTTGQGQQARIQVDSSGKVQIEERVL